MSGAEFLAVVGGISAILNIADAIADIYKTIKDIHGLPEAFSVVNGRLPIVKDILESTKRHIDAVQDEAVCKGIKHIVVQCEMSTKMLNEIFEKVKPDDGAWKVERYWKAVKAKGKGHKVETLMADILVDIQLLDSQHGMNTATEDQQKEIMAAIKELSEVQPSVPDSEFHEAGVTMNQSGSGTQQYTAKGNVYSSGGGKQFNAERQYFVNENPERNEDRCMQALFLTDPRDDRERLVNIKGSRVKGTCEWIKSNALYDSWFRSYSQLLWLSGGPGQGKTMLSVFLAEELERTASDSPNTLVLQYFCDNKDERRNTAVAIIRGLIFQLLQFRPKLINHILPSFKIQKESLFTGSSFETLWRIFNTMIRDPVLSIVYCVLDGLDECDEASLEILLRKFKSIFSTGAGLSHSLKLIVVSRDLPEFIPKLLSNVPRIRLNLNAYTEVNNDIQRFIEARVDRLSNYGQYPESLRAHVKTVFRNRAQGKFLWIALVAKALEGYQTTEVRRELDRFPPGLDELYARMLLQIEASRRELAAKILLWVVIATRPLTLTELGTAVGISIEHSGDFSLAQVTRDQVSYCGSFITIEKDEVGLIHQSAKDYLLRETPDSNSELEVFRVQEEAGNLELARRCLKYLQDGAFAGGQVDLGENTIHLDAFPLISYAALHWPDHARAIVHSGDIFDLALPFYYKKSQIRESWLKTYWSMKEYGKPPKSFTLLHLASYFGILQLAENILRKRGWIMRVKGLYNINKRDGNGTTALIWAARKGHDTIVRLLLDNKADVKAKDDIGYTALIWAARKGHETVAQLLLERGADVEAGDGWKALIWAAQGGHEVVVRLLLENGADVEAKGSDGATALLWAAQEGHETIIRLLLENKANIDAKDDGYYTALIWAIRKGHNAVVKLLLEKGADVEAGDGWTALIWAAWEGHEAAVRLLLEKGADVDAKTDYNSTTAIFWAAQRGHEAIIRLLTPTSNP